MIDTSFERYDYGYTILSRLEACLRERIAEVFMDAHEWRSRIPPGLVGDDARGNTGVSKPLPDFLEELQFVQLEEIIRYGDNSALVVDASCGSGPQEVCESIAELYDYRCRIAHIRRRLQPLSLIDLERIHDLSRDIAACIGEPGRAFTGFLRDLDSDPERNVRKMPDSLADAGLLGQGVLFTQLSLPDYELDGGWVGRTDDIKRVLNLLSSSHRVVTIAGAGGVGKTALARKVVDRVLDGVGPSVDLLVWTSAKNRELSWLGLRDIEQPLRTFENLLEAVLDAAGLEVPTDTAQLQADASAVLEMSDCALIVVDNLETIEDERILDFVLDGPDGVRFLLTSRRGLGQVERRYELGQMSLKEAEYLFRRVARQKGLDNLASASSAVVQRYVEKVACYPLAIKWLIAQVALGKDVDDSVRAIESTDSEIARFTFQQVFETLSRESQRLLSALAMQGEPTSPGVLKHLSELEQSEFDDCIRSLLVASLIINSQVETEDGRLETRYDLLSLTRGYVMGRVDADADLKQWITGRQNRMRSYLEEAEKYTTRERVLRNLGANTEEEKIAAVTATHAYRLFKAGNYAGAVQRFRRAAELAPGLASIYRNWGTVEYESNHPSEAESLFKKATELDPDDPVTWGIWGNVRRKAGDYTGAVDCLTRALQIMPDQPAALISLAQTYTQASRYGDALETGNKALQLALDRGDERTEIVARTVIAATYRRQFQSLEDDAAAELGPGLLHQAQGQLRLSLSLDPSDISTREEMVKVQVDLSNLNRQMDQIEASDECLRAAMQVSEVGGLEKQHAQAAYMLAKRLFERGQIDQAAAVLSGTVVESVGGTSLGAKMERLRSSIEAMREKPHRGEICFVHASGAYAYVKDEGSGETYFAHSSRFNPQVESIPPHFRNAEVLFWPNTRVAHLGEKIPIATIRLAGTVG